MSGPIHLNLLPPLVEHGRTREFIDSGYTLSMSLSPLDNSVAVFVTETAGNRARKTTFPEQQPIYFATTDAHPSSERRLFVTDTLIIFAAFRNLIKTARSKRSDWLQGEECQNMIRKLATDYINFTKECWIHASQPITRLDGPLQYSGDHYRSLYTCFSLFLVLYIPESGLENAPIGEELMEWLNTHFIEPSTEEGDHLSGLESPWEDDSFWPYVTRSTLRGLSKASVFFLRVLSRHPTRGIQDLADRLASLIENQPRLQNFSAEREFAHATRRWKDKVKTLRIDMNQVDPNERHDGFENWWDRLSDIVSILEGRADAIKRICRELGADWKDVCAAWGVFIDTRLRGIDVPDIVAHVQEDMPPDSSNLEDMIHAALFAGQPANALTYAAQLDPWLAAHLGDVMEALSLIDGDVNEETGLSIRDQYISSYAEYLHTDPALWPVSVEYLYSCGLVGKERADEILVRVPLRLTQNEELMGESTEPGTVRRIKAGDVVGVLQKVNQMCLEHQREGIRRTVCKIAAQTFIRGKDYGLAIAYFTSAEDWHGLGKVVDRVLYEYITNGAEKFITYASDIASSLQDLYENPGPHAIFIHQLMFAVQYAQFHQYLSKNELQNAVTNLLAMFHDDVVPKSWWAVLLCDLVDLLQSSPTLILPTWGAREVLAKLEEISARTSQGSGDDYLSVLRRITKDGEENDALERLGTARLVLARYFARCALKSVGGKSVVDQRTQSVI